VTDCILRKIVSGGQTGADRAALDFAIEHGIEHGGWCPAGRRAEDGPLDARYAVQDTPSPQAARRTEWNVRDSDGTVIFSLAPVLHGGTKLAQRFTREYRMPLLHLTPNSPDAARELDAFVVEYRVAVLNVAGPRESEEPGIGDFVRSSLENWNRLCRRESFAV
jgi:hypothetical protein